MNKNGTYKTPAILNSILSLDYAISVIYYPIILILFLMKAGQYYLPLSNFFGVLIFIIFTFIIQFYRFKIGEQANLSVKQRYIFSFIGLSFITTVFYIYIAFLQSYM